ncbi:MAG: tetratricopeptide repeat protein [Magnetococcales bacterium]|nr:tetratricopeptide repeat protein [Magnetococcales bacterium]
MRAIEQTGSILLLAAFFGVAAIPSPGNGSLFRPVLAHPEANLVRDRLLFETLKKGIDFRHARVEGLPVGGYRVLTLERSLRRMAVDGSAAESTPSSDPPVPTPSQEGPLPFRKGEDPKATSAAKPTPAAVSIPTTVSAPAALSSGPAAATTEPASAEERDTVFAIIDQAIVANPGEAKNFLARARWYESRKRYWLAIKDYDAAIKLDPKQADAFHRRGLVLIAVEDLGSAVTDFERAVALNPEDAAYYYSLSGAYYRIGLSYYAAWGFLNGLVRDSQGFAPLAGRWQRSEGEEPWWQKIWPLPKVG